MPRYTEETVTLSLSLSLLCPSSQWSKRNRFMHGYSMSIRINARKYDSIYLLVYSPQYPFRISNGVVIYEMRVSSRCFSSFFFHTWSMCFERHYLQTSLTSDTPPMWKIDRSRDVVINIRLPYDLSSGRTWIARMRPVVCCHSPCISQH